jgi:hypothetical protein
MSQLERNQCAVSGAKDLEHLYTFKDFPVFMGCVDRSEGMDLKADMSWWISRESGLIQLKNLIPLDVLYPESHGAGAVGSLWDEHHKTFAKFLAEKKPSSVLEIGGGHGRLETAYQEFDQISWTILEPNPSPVDGCKAAFIRGFFDEKFKLDTEVEAIVHSHLFEHIYEPQIFMRQLSDFMRDDQQLVFSLPNMRIMLERKYTNCINFEHTLFLTEEYVDHLLAKHGFRIDSKEYFKDDHSIFYRAIRDQDIASIPLSSDLYLKNKTLYGEYINFHIGLIKEINQKLNEIKQPIYLFGAHVFAQYLVAFGLDTSRITGLLDNDKNKHGKRLSGTNLKVFAPSVLKELDAPHVVLRAGVYNSEIKKDILENINKSTVFL